MKNLYITMYVERDVGDYFRKIASAYNVVAIVGPRQAGKTTFLREESRGRNASYVLFDDPDPRSLFEEDVKKFEKQYVEGYEVAILDEVQYCRDAGIKIKYLSEMGHRIWLTSSSEVLLGRDILSCLVGRVSIVKLYPFSFPEFLKAEGVKEASEESLRREVWEHMTYGGYPKVVLTGDLEIKKTMLRDLHETMILKDVSKTFSIDDVISLEKLARHLAANPGGAVSYESLSADLKLSFQTLRKYLDALEKSYLLKRVPPFYTNKAKEIAKQPKTYFLDCGLRNAVTGTFPAEPSGRDFESYVLSELLKIGHFPRYWRTKSDAEVDYVIEKDGETIPLEVKVHTEVGKVERGMHSFIEAYAPKKGFVVSYKGENGRIKLKGCSLTYTNITGLWKELGRA